MQRSKLGMWKGYHLSLEGIQKGYLFCLKWYIQRVKGWSLGQSLFGECPLYFSALQNSQNFFKIFILTVTIRSPQVQLSDTRTVTKKLVVNLLDPILLSLIVWPHRNFRWLLILPIGSAYIHVKMATYYLSRNMITTRFRQTWACVNSKLDLTLCTSFIKLSILVLTESM